MHVKHGASVVVTDGRKALLLRNDGDGDFLDLHLVHKWEEAIPADHELKSDGPGRTSSTYDHGSRRRSYEEKDFHDQAEVKFAGQLADFLNGETQHAPVSELIIVAPPRTLGELRKHLRRETADRITAELAKDLVKHPIAAIERLITRSPQPA